MLFSKRLYKIFGDEKNLGNKLHSFYISTCDKKRQIEMKRKLEALIKNYDDGKFSDLAYNSDTKKLIQEVIELKNEQDWFKVIIKYFLGLSDLLEREIKKAVEIPQRETIIGDIGKKIKKIYIFHPSDIIKINEEEKGIFMVNYVSRKFSPEFNGKFGMWRDTEFIFTLNFKKNLFIWNYINIHNPLRGKGLGTILSKYCENFGKDLGFKRFMVQYPNSDYWIKKMSYSISNKCRIGSGRYSYTHEAYKEIG